MVVLLTLRGFLLQAGASLFVQRFVALGGFGRVSNILQAQSNSRGPKKHINIRILPTMVSGIASVLGFRRLLTLGRTEQVWVIAIKGRALSFCQKYMAFNRSDLETSS